MVLPSIEMQDNPLYGTSSDPDVSLSPNPMYQPRMHVMQQNEYDLTEADDV